MVLEHYQINPEFLKEARIVTWVTQKCSKSTVLSWKRQQGVIFDRELFLMLLKGSEWAGGTIMCTRQRIIKREYNNYTNQTY